MHKDTTLISIGVISEDGKTFYAELNDYDKSQVDEWIQNNVIDNLYLKQEQDPYLRGRIDVSGPNNDCFDVVGDMNYVAQALKFWIGQFDDIKIWSDCLAYDWVLFNHLFGHAFNLPKNIYYIPFDICTLFEVKEIDADISREEFIGNAIEGKKHNSLYDAKVIKACYDKLMEI